MEKPGGGKGEAERREEEERKKGLLHKTHQRICAVQMGIVWKKKKTGCVQVKEKQLCSKQQHYIWNLWPRYSIFTEKKQSHITIVNLKETTQDYYMVLTVADHAGLVSVKLDYFCYFGAELNFFVKLRRTKRSHYINDETTAYFIHILVGG